MHSMKTDDFLINQELIFCCWHCLIIETNLQYSMKLVLMKRCCFCCFAEMMMYPSMICRLYICKCIKNTIMIRHCCHPQPIQFLVVLHAQQWRSFLVRIRTKIIIKAEITSGKLQSKNTNEIWIGIEMKMKMKWNELVD